MGRCRYRWVDRVGLIMMNSWEAGFSLLRVMGRGGGPSGGREGLSGLKGDWTEGGVDEFKDQ